MYPPWFKKNKTHSKNSQTVFKIIDIVVNWSHRYNLILLHGHRQQGMMPKSKLDASNNASTLTTNTDVSTHLKLQFAILKWPSSQHSLHIRQQETGQLTFSKQPNESFLPSHEHRPSFNSQNQTHCICAMHSKPYVTAYRYCGPWKTQLVNRLC